MTKRASTDYPPQMMAALERARLDGQFIIPTDKAKALRLEFQRLRGALRAEGRAEQIDSLSFHVTPDALTIRLMAASPLMADLSAALGGSSQENPADLFNNLFGENDAPPAK